MRIAGEFQCHDMSGYGMSHFSKILVEWAGLACRFLHK